MKQIFVFGSNREGRHGKGAALQAVQDWGAIYGAAEGLQGNSYAIVTKELRSGQPPVSLAEVKEGVAKFRKFVHNNQNLFFYVTPIGTGLAGFRVDQIKPLFAWAKEYPNVQLPKELKD